MGSGFREQLSFMLDPTVAARGGEVRGGWSRPSGRARNDHADAVPRAVDLRGRPGLRELDELGGGAERHRLEVDAQRGVLLEVLALRDAEPFQKITTLEIKLNLPISEERFGFQLPAGEGIQPTPGEAP